MGLAARAWRELGRDSLLYLSGEGLGKGLVYLLLFLLAGFLSVADFGAVNLFIAVSGPLALVIGLGLPEALNRFFFGDDPFDRVLASALALLAAGAAAVTLLVLLARGPIERTLELPPLLVPLALVCAPALAVRSAWLSVLRAEGRSRLFAAARLIEPLVSLAIVLGLVALAGGLELRSILLAYLSGILAVALVGLVRLVRRARGRPSAELSRRLLAYSSPVILHALAGAGLTSFDQLILNQILGLEPTGIYAFAYRVGMAMFLVAFGVSSAWGPLVLRQLQERRGLGEVRSLLGLLSAVVPAAGVALMALLPPLSRTLGAAEYRASEALIPIVVCGYVWMALYVLATPFLAFRNRTLTLASYSATALLVNIGLNYLLIPHLGPLAAALSTLLSYQLLFALTWWRALRDFPGLPVAGLAAGGLLTMPAALAAWWLLS